MIGMVLWWGFILFAFILLIRWFMNKSVGSSGNPGGKKSNENPMDFLKIRYASGEISKEEFDRMKRDLN